MVIMLLTYLNVKQKITGTINAADTKDVEIAFPLTYLRNF